MIKRTSTTTKHLWNLDDVLHSLHCEYPFVWKSAKSDDELNPRHLRGLVRQGLLELEHRDVDEQLHGVLFLGPLHNDVTCCLLLVTGDM